MSTMEDILPKLANVKVFTVLDAKIGFYQVKLDEAIASMPRSDDKKTVKRLLGYVNYLSRFLPKLSELSPFKN